MADKCARCGSTKIIPDIPMWDHIGDFGVRASQARVEVHGNPKAFVFRDTAIGQLSVNICGACGHAELFVSDHDELYQAFLKSQE